MSRVHSPHVHVFAIAGLRSLFEDLHRPMTPFICRRIARDVSGLRVLIGLPLMSVILWRIVKFKEGTEASHKTPS